MKKFLLLAIAMIATTTVVTAQEDYIMKVHRVSGAIEEFEVSGLEKITYDPSPWVSLGMCQYTEDFIADYYYIRDPGDIVITYEVEIQENSEQPGLFRLVNPYGEPYPYNEPGWYDDTKNYYLEVNACDPDGVYIREQDTGCNWGDGDFVVYSWAAWCMDELGYSLSRTKQTGYCGTYKDGVITFPERALLLNTAYDPYTYYYANGYGAFKIVMPDAIASAPASVAVEKTEGQKHLMSPETATTRMLELKNE